MDTPIKKSDLLTTKQAFEYLGGITADTLLTRRVNGDVAYYKLGGRYYYAKADLDDYIARCRVPVREKPRVSPSPPVKSAIRRGPGRPPNKPPVDCGYYPGMKVV